MTTPKAIFFRVRFLDLLKRPYEGLYHEIRKAGDKYATSAGNADGDGNGVWMKLTVGTVLDVAVKDPKTKAMMTLYPPVVVPATKSTLVITAPHFKETTKLQPREGEQGSYQRKTHTVKQGETLESIAKQYDTTWQVLHQLNKDKIKDADKIQVGLVLKVPPKDSGLRGGAKASSSSPKSTPNTTKITSSDYTVQQGDTLGSIAQRSGKSIADLQRLNGIHDPNKIKAGQRLKTGVPNQPPKANTTPKSTTPASQNGGILDDITKTVKEGADWVDKTTQPLQDKVSQAINEGGQALSSAADAVTGWFGGGDKTSSNTPTSAQAPSGKVADKPVQKSTTQDNSQKTGTPKLEVSTKGDCVCQTYNLIWGGHPNVTCEFRKKVVEICKELWADDWLAMANNLMALMHLETAGSFSPKTDNGKDKDKEGYGYVGLIQFGNSTVTDLSAIYGKISKRQLVNMSAVEQLEWVKRYFRMWMKRGKKIRSFVEMYLVILYPKTVTGRQLNDNDVIFRDDSNYRSNLSFMKEKGERRAGGFKGGATYVWEVKQEIELHYKDGEKSSNRNFKAICGVIQRPAKQESGGSSWQNPLKNCQVRRFGYSSLPLRKGAAEYNKHNLSEAVSVASAFVSPNRYRASGKHQGLDLEAEPNTPIYAVCKGKVVLAGTYGTGNTYGKAIIIECKVSDLPNSKQTILKNQLNFKGDFVYFVYCHLNKVNVTRGDVIDSRNFSNPIGLSGSSGNATNMKTIAQGAHLHFEVRDNAAASMGQTGMKYRYNPFPLLDNCFTTENGVK